MGVDLDKVEREAPHLVDLYKNVGIVLEKDGRNPDDYKAAVIGTSDHSGSTEDWPNKLYSDGTMQRVSELAFATGLRLDDDGEVPWSLFSSRVNSLGMITLRNSKGFMDQHRRHEFGNTNYLAALKWIVETAGFGHVDLRPRRGTAQAAATASSGRRSGFFSGWRRSQETYSEPAYGPLEYSAKATAPYPTFAIFITDGEPSNPEHEIIEYLAQMSQLPIFVQFIGVGQHNFRFLRHLDTLSSRYEVRTDKRGEPVRDGLDRLILDEDHSGVRFVDNANFFDSREAGNQTEMLELLLGEFPLYYERARATGLITG